VGEQRGHGPPKFLENIVILCFERRFSKQNSVIRLKSNILPPQNFDWLRHWQVVSSAIFEKLECPLAIIIISCYAWRGCRHEWKRLLKRRLSYSAMQDDQFMCGELIGKWEIFLHSGAWTWAQLVAQEPNKGIVWSTGEWAAQWLPAKHLPWLTLRVYIEAVILSCWGSATCIKSANSRKVLPSHAGTRYWLKRIKEGFLFNFFTKI